MFKKICLAGILGLLIINPAQAADHQRELKFAPGADKGVVENSVVRGDRDVISFYAEKGQYCGITLTSLQNNTSLAVLDKDGKLLGGNVDTCADGGAYWWCILPYSGCYKIALSPTFGNTSYKAEVTIFR